MKLGQRYTAWLRKTYPRAFSNKRRPPLMRGVYEVLLADPERPPWATDAAIQWALSRWCRHPRYRASVRRGRQRRMLDGTLLARTTEKEREMAKETSQVSTPTNPPTTERGEATPGAGQGTLAGTESPNLPRGK